MFKKLHSSAPKFGNRLNSYAIKFGNRLPTSKSSASNAAAQHEKKSPLEKG